MKYGPPGVSIHCDTAKAKMERASCPASRFVTRLGRENDLSGNFGTTCLFLGQRNTSNRIRRCLLLESCLQRIEEHRTSSFKDFESH